MKQESVNAASQKSGLVPPRPAKGTQGGWGLAAEKKIRRIVFLVYFTINEGFKTFALKEPVYFQGRIHDNYLHGKPHPALLADIFDW